MSECALEYVSYVCVYVFVVSSSLRCGACSTADITAAAAAVVVLVVVDDVIRGGGGGGGDDDDGGAECGFEGHHI